MKQSLNEEFRRMQKLAGIINENNDGIDPNDLELFKNTGELNNFKFYNSSTIDAYKNMGKNVPKGVITDFLNMSRNNPKYNAWIYNEYFERANEELGLGFDKSDEILDMLKNADEGWQAAFAKQVVDQTKEKIGKGFEGSNNAEYQIVKNIINKAYKDNQPY
jgi:hypothetical protein